MPKNPPRPASVIVTVKNEQQSLPRLLESLFAQTVEPAEVVVADGGSTDGTLAVLEAYKARGFPLTVLSVPGANISQGRNAAIAAARCELIASTDAGVVLEPNWLSELLRPFSTPDPPDVVAGFFTAAPCSTFEKALGATTLPDLRDIRPAGFLPSSRSVAFTRSAWQVVAGYPEWLDYCEDVVFDLKLRQAGLRFAFAPLALAHFRPRPDLRSFFRQYYRYARGDGKAGLFARRHAVRYATYTVGPLAFLAGIWYKRLWLPLALAALAYSWMPYRRLLPSFRDERPWERMASIALVPAIRLVGDVAKMIGYPVGLCWRWRWRGLRNWRE
ncbi:MAG: glycosyltransferase [Chloroflexi bacterium]|nr:glycosyltransferase [Chloroflexota bacterium]